MKLHRQSKRKILTLHFISFPWSRDVNDLTWRRANISGEMSCQAREEEI
jgi:hypothetical protein